MSQTHLREAAGVWDSESGAFINQRHQHMAQVLHDYNPYFSLVWIPPKDRDETDSKPYAILNSSPAGGRAPHIIRYLSEAEMDNPAEILAWVFDGDIGRHGADAVFTRLENKRVAEELMELKARQEEVDDILEFGEYVFGDRSPHWMKHNGQTYRK